MARLKPLPSSLNVSRASRRRRASGVSALFSDRGPLGRNLIRCRRLCSYRDCEASREQGQEDCSPLTRYWRALFKHCTLCFRGVSTLIHIRIFSDESKIYHNFPNPLFLAGWGFVYFGTSYIFANAILEVLDTPVCAGTGTE